MTSPPPPPPADPQAIDAPWITGALRHAGAISEASRVTAVRVGPVDLGGVNGDVYRLLLRYAGPPGPLTLIAKYPATRPGARRTAVFQRWYEREIRAYRDLDGRLGGDADRLPMPAWYYAEETADDGFVLLLEDLGVRGQGDQLAGCSIDDATLAIRTIARVHARWWDAPQLHGALDWLPLTTVGVDHAQRIQDAFARAWSVVGAVVREPRAFAAGVPAVIDAYPALLAEAARPPLTVIHGDYRLDNLFFDTHGGAPRVRAIDWQFTSRCRGMYDVAYFVGLDLQPDARRAHEAALRETYLSTLIEAGVRGYTADTAERDYALGLLLTFATFVIGAAGGHGNARMRAVHDVGLHRVATAIVENDATRILA